MVYQSVNHNKQIILHELIYFLQILADHKETWSFLPFIGGYNFRAFHPSGRKVISMFLQSITSYILT